MERSHSIVGLITARGGSKGIPRKNLRLVGGKPLIAYTIEAARSARSLTRVLVSTDDEEVARVSADWGAEAPFRRPADLSTDTASHLDVVLHAAEWLEREQNEPLDYLVTLQPTSPFRTPGDIDGAVELALSRSAGAVVAVCPSPAHPFLTKSIDEQGAIGSFVATDLAYLRRQDFPPAFVINGAVYVNRVSSLRRERTMFPHPTLAYVMPESRSFDLDTPQDLAICDFLMRQNQPQEPSHAPRAA